MVNGCLPNWHLWVADKEARGPADIWGNGPLAASSPDPTGCGYPHVRLVMHVLNYARHATARPKSSRHVDELRDERAQRTAAGPAQAPSSS